MQISGFSFNLCTWQASKLKSMIIRCQTTTVPVQCNPSILLHRHLNHLVDWLLFLLLDSYKNIGNYDSTRYLALNLHFYSEVRNHLLQSWMQKTVQSQMRFNYFCTNLVTGVPLNTHMHSVKYFFVTYHTMMPVPQIAQIDGRVINQSERICMKADVMLWWHYHSIFIEGLSAQLVFWLRLEVGTYWMQV
jgi:hypothetical protein